MGNGISTKSKEFKNLLTNLTSRNSPSNRQPCIKDKGFSVETIVRILSSTPGYASFLDRWSSLAIALEINSVIHSRWQHGLNVGTLDINMVPGKILHEWASKSENGAKISDLIDTLRSIEMNDMANRLQELLEKYPNFDITNSNGVSINIAGAGHSSITINNNREVERDVLLPPERSTESTEQTQSSTETQENKKKKWQRKWIICVALLLVLVLMLIAFSLIVYYAVFHSSEPETETSNPCVSHEWANEEMQESLEVKLNRKGEWPSDALLKKPCSTKELNITGILDFNLLSQILNQTTQVESIYLEITSQSECDEYDTQTGIANLNQNYASILPNLRTLTLAHSCANTWLYMYLSSLQMENLETFNITNGIINEASMKYIRLIHTQSKRLKIFHLTAQLTTDQQFYPTDHKSLSLKEVRIDNLTTLEDSEYPRLILREDFCKALLELTVFQSMNSCISFNDRYLVFDCLSLKKLSIAICYSGNEYYRLGIAQKLSHLEDIDFTLHFPHDNCPPPEELQGVRQEVFNSTVKSISVCSNCNLHPTRESFCVA